MPSVPILPYLKVTTAVAPFVLALLMRFLVGRNRLTQLLLSIATTWFAVNVVLSPFTNFDRIGDWWR
jgi:hypothetical protein